MDPHEWLEDVVGDDALGWVRERNALTVGEYGSSDDFVSLRDDLLAIYDADDRIPVVRARGEKLYNFWRDGEHPRGLWRRTTLDEYRGPSPLWESVLDLDALAEAEGENWVWHGADVLRPGNRRALIALSRGGADADVTREFDLETLAFVEDGFVRPESKGGLSWIDDDTVFLVSAEGPETVNLAGYGRLVRQWCRGTPIESAEVVFEGPADNNGYGIYPGRDHAEGFERDLLVHYLDSRDTALYVRAIGEAGFTKVEVPDSASKDVHRQWLTIELREPWTVDGVTYPAGALLVARFDEWLAGDRRSLEMVFEPTDTTSLVGVTYTRGHLVLNVLDDVKNALVVLTHGGAGWSRCPLGGVPKFGTIAVSAVDSDETDGLWLSVNDYLNPPSLLLGSADAVAPAPEVLKSQPAMFDASRHVAEQHFVVSLDGTRVPYFLVRPKDAPFDGSTPTLLYGYGGFEIPLLPGYSGGIGKGWLEKGGAYVVANIRGGSEYGPRWHQAALRQNRHRAYEDFAAVARDLVATGLTSPEHLGMMGGSNGGLLAGNMLTQYPELFGAIVIRVPLLDMQRYHTLLAGASWMAEYGDPDDPADWEFIRGFSPYHLFDADREYPPTLIMTSTRDDRVHPGHARKFMAKMLEAGKDVRYYENIEGGHGGAADNGQAARMDALYLTFLWRQLAG